MKLTRKLTLASITIVFLLIIYLGADSLNANCFSMKNYLISFVSLFANMTINIMEVLGL
jgi:hypothetical protein